MEATEFQKLFKVIPLLPTDGDELMNVAFHESGHVLIDLLSGFTPGSVSIIPNSQESTAGRAYNLWEGYSSDFDSYLSMYDKWEEWNINRKIEFLVCSLLGGVIGESLYSGQYNWEGSENDLNRIFDIFLGYGINDIPGLQSYWDKTWDMINSNKDSLFKLANDLYSAKELSPEYFRLNWSELIDYKSDLQ